VKALVLLIIFGGIVWGSVILYEYRRHRSKPDSTPDHENDHE
jgi:hypothetical protein